MRLFGLLESGYCINGFKTLSLSVCDNNRKLFLVNLLSELIEEAAIRVATGHIRLLRATA